ncbi:hypothetical protein CH366_01915 [Leptospira harrisiae]|uniref:Uncharacterized protein n=1 Tax=Leptospira harrisiae TaxID=2023189 RepID=A0A2N0ALG0_9LEPT|nr:hypothetical protein CH364_01915 [Leptospira harrisiae]PKA08556.1 hypothetical protein CH366_01915 [Leptospira harrisiae]
MFNGKNNSFCYKSLSTNMDLFGYFYYFFLSFYTQNAIIRNPRQFSFFPILKNLIFFTDSALQFFKKPIHIKCHITTINISFY